MLFIVLNFIKYIYIYISFYKEILWWQFGAYLSTTKVPEHIKLYNDIKKVKNKIRYHKKDFVSINTINI